MLLGPPEILYCPFCNTPYLMQSILSGNTFGGIQFSDGQAFYPMLPEQPRITRCDACANYFWLKDIEINENIENFGGEEEPPFVRWLEQDEWVEAISKMLYRDNEDETYLRTRLWWVLNNKYRHENRRKVDHEKFPEDLYYENLQRLLDLIKQNAEADQLLLAEIHRELGYFQEALDLLKKAEKHDYPIGVIRQMREKAKDKNPYMFKLNREP